MSSAELALLKRPMKLLHLFRINHLKISQDLSQTLTWTGKSWLFSSVSDAVVIKCVCGTWCVLLSWTGAAMMSSLRTICLAIRRWVEPPRLATYETVWKVWLHRFHLYLTSSSKCTDASANPNIFFICRLTRTALISSEDAVRVELSLRVAEDLVRKNVFAAREVWQQHTTEILFELIVFLQKGVVPHLTVAACTGIWIFCCFATYRSLFMLRFIFVCLFFRSVSSWPKYFFTWRINTA